MFGRSPFVSGAGSSVKTFEELLEQQLKLEEVSGVHSFSFPCICAFSVVHYNYSTLTLCHIYLQFQGFQSSDNITSCKPKASENISKKRSRACKV